MPAVEFQMSHLDNHFGISSQAQKKTSNFR